MNRIAIFLVGAAVAFSVHATGQPTLIKGQVKDLRSGSIEIGTFSDYITNTYTALAQTTISPNGQFELKLSLNSVRSCKLRLGQQQVDLIVEPGLTYLIEVSNVIAQDTRKQVLPHYLIPPFEIKITNPRNNELNGLVARFNSIHDNFLTENHQALIRQGSKQKVADYNELIDKNFSGVHHQWFNTYTLYHKAQIQLMAKTINKESAIRQYILGKPVLYHHPVYMDFFLQVFDKYALLPSSPIRRDDILKAVSSSDAFRQLDQLFVTDPLLKDRPVREVLIILTLWECYSQPDFKKEDVIKALRQCSTQSTLPEHRQIAGNMVAMLQQ